MKTGELSSGFQWLPFLVLSRFFVVLLLLLFPFWLNHSDLFPSILFSPPAKKIPKIAAFMISCQLISNIHYFIPVHCSKWWLGPMLFSWSPEVLRPIWYWGTYVPIKFFKGLIYGKISNHIILDIKKWDWSSIVEGLLVQSKNTEEHSQRTAHPRGLREEVWYKLPSGHICVSSHRLKTEPR